LFRVLIVVLSPVLNLLDQLVDILFVVRLALTPIATNCSRTQKSNKRRTPENRLTVAPVLALARHALLLGEALVLVVGRARVVLDQRSRHEFFGRLRGDRRTRHAATRGRRSQRARRTCESDSRGSSRRASWSEREIGQRGQRVAQRSANDGGRACSRVARDCSDSRGQTTRRTEDGRRGAAAKRARAHHVAPIAQVERLIQTKIR